MKNKNIKDKDIDGIVEVLDKYKEYGETAEGRETDVIHWRNFEKIAREILSKLKENEIVLAEGYYNYFMTALYGNNKDKTDLMNYDLEDKGKSGTLIFVSDKEIK